MKIKYLLIALAAFGALASVVNPTFAQNWTQTSAPDDNWNSVASSADGTKLVAVSGGLIFSGGDSYHSGWIYVSTNSGAAWTRSSAPEAWWTSVASSADGTKLASAALDTYRGFGLGGIYTSSDSGATWTRTSAPGAGWLSIACSADGTQLVGAGDTVYTSTNSGATWALTRTPTNDVYSWSAVASSADGTRLVATVAGVPGDGFGADGLIYTSVDSGTTWAPTAAPNFGWSTVASSSDGTKLVAGDTGLVVKNIYTSADSGATWTLAPVLASAVASSGDGTKLLVAGGNGTYGSTDSGRTWGKTSQYSELDPVTSLAGSEDGGKWFVTTTRSTFNPGSVYTWQLTNLAVIAQPASQTVLAGTDVTFSVGVFGPAPLAYQWTFRGTNLAGATKATLTLTNVRLFDSGWYAVVATNNFGSVSSSNALLTVLPVLVTTQPASGIGPSTATLNGLVTPGSRETFVWFEWGADTNYGHVTPAADIGQGFVSMSFASPLTGLPRFGIYHYRAVASNVLGALAGADAWFLKGGQFATALDTNGTTWQAVGAYNVEAGAWYGANPPVYSGVQAANLIFGNPPPGEMYAISVSNNFVTHTAHLDGYDDAKYVYSQSLDENYSFEIANGYQAGYGYGTAYSAYVNDHSTSPDTINYVWKAATTNWAMAWTLSVALRTNWFAVASSADGSKLVAAAGGISDGYPNGLAPIYTSTNSGADWTTAGGPSADWQTLASSADGSKLVAAARSYSANVGGSWVPIQGAIYISTNSGATWDLTSAPITNWTAIVSSADGTKLVAAGAPGIYTSTDSGAHWISNNAPSLGWQALASSADGAKLVAAAYPGIYTSINSGATWTSNSALKGWTLVASSADGLKLVGATSDGNGGGRIYTSTNSGATWTPTSAPSKYWSSVASSADGAKLAAAGGDTLFISADAGATWTQTTGIGYALASSADGNKLVAVVSGGGIYTLQTTPTPALTITPSSGNALLAWIIPSMDFRLQQNSDLTTTNWTDMTTPPVLNLTNLENQVMLPPTNSRSFYRLRL